MASTAARGSPALSDTWLAVLLGGVVLAAGYPFVGSPTTRAASAAAASLVAAAAVAAGLRLYRPRRWLPWALAGASQLLWAVGGALWTAEVASTGFGLSMDSPFQLVYIAGDLLLAGALASMLLARASPLVALTDAAIIAATSTSVVWVTVTHEYLHAGYLTDRGVATVFGFFVADFLLIGLGVRLLISHERSVPFVLLTLAGFGVVFSDITWNWLTVGGSYLPGVWADVGWLVSSALIAVAALHPGMARTFEPRSVGPPLPHRLEIGLIAVAGVVPAVTAMVIAGSGDSHQERGLAAATVVVVLLVVLRMAFLVRAADVSAIELRAANARLLELDRMKNDFVASVSHELRTPLTSIRGYTELLADGDAGDLNPGQAEYVEIIDRNGRRLLALVSDLLDVGAIQSGRFALDLGEASVDGIAREAVQRAGPRAGELGIAITLEAGTVSARVDATRIGQLLDNLISNSLKFTAPGGSVAVRVHARAGSVAIEVQDDGAGIAPEELPHVFDRFYRSRSAGEAAVEGTGLGLAIVAAVAEAHGGSVDVDSRPGAGSTFRVVLPARGPASSGPRESFA